MDRASDSGSEGWGFESLPAYQKRGGTMCLLFFGTPEERDSNNVNARLRGSFARRVGSRRNLTICLWQIVTSPFRRQGNGLPRRCAPRNDTRNFVGLGISNKSLSVPAVSGKKEKLSNVNATRCILYNVFDKRSF